MVMNWVKRGQIKVNDLNGRDKREIGGKKLVKKDKYLGEKESL